MLKLSLICDLAGAVVKLGRDEVGLAARWQAGCPFTALVDEGSAGKADAFLAAVQSECAAFDWEINLPDAQRPRTLFFTGTRNGQHILILGGGSRISLADYHEESVRLLGEAGEPLSDVLAERSRHSQLLAERDSALFDEMMLLNNELANLQRELVRKNAELQRLNDEKNQVLGMAAHDLRNPLIVISAYAHLLLAEGGPAVSGEHRESLEAIRASSEQMLHIVDGMLDVSAIEAGKLELSTAPTDLAACVAKNLGLARYLAGNKQIDLSFEHDAGVPPVPLDPARFAQVVNNLLSNAIKYSPRGGRVRVTVRRDGEHAVLAVSDAGPGIRETEMDRLFKPFSRTSNKVVGGGRSTGLGLAIVRRLVAAHRGEIRVQSEVGQGSTFSVLLPLEAPVAAGTALLRPDQTRGE
jgi:signal transduction histidine kinase